jgi:hypothetical protein
MKENDDKEEFIKNNLIEKGFEEKAFKDFLISKKGEEVEDIYSLSLEELEKEVKDFLEKQKTEQKEDENKEVKEEDTKDKIEEKSDEKKEEEKIEQKEEKEEKSEIKDNIINDKNESENKIEIKDENVEEKKDDINKNKIQIINEYFSNEKKVEEEDEKIKEIKNDEVNIENENQNKIIESDKDNSKKEQKKEKKEKTKKEKEPKKEKKEEKKEKKEIKQPKKEEPKMEMTLPPEIYGIICPRVYEECKTLGETPLSSVENLVITISSPEKIEGTFLTKTFVTYLVTTKEPKLSVKRRYSDFVWFHQTLLYLYPYLVIPPVPKKNKIGIDNLSDVFISKRMRYLQKFMDWLITNPIIKSSDILYEFLRIETEEDFNKLKLRYQKVAKPLNLIEFYHQNGKMDLTLNKDKEKYFKKIETNNINNEILLNNLNISLKQLKFQFDILINLMEEVQQNWEVLYVTSTKRFENANMTNTYNKMNKLFFHWVNSLKKQNDLLFIDVREYFKYVKNNFRDMKANINNVEDVKNEYYRFERFLINKKEDLFKKGDVTKWELDPQEKASGATLASEKLSALFKMCAKDTDRCIQRKVYYGYYLNQLIEDYERMRDFNGGKYKETQINFSTKLSEIITEFSQHIEESLVEPVIDEKKE